MLIDTQQIISKTDLRDNFNRLLSWVAKGNEMVVTDRGKFIVKMSPITGEKKSKSYLHNKFEELEEELKDVGSAIDSTDFIRKMRDSRK